VTEPGDDVGARLRPTVRVLLLDPDDRVLLVRSLDEQGLGFWFPPGGGVDAGESLEDAAVRELAEETGLHVETPGDLFARRRHVVQWDGVWVDVRESWFLLRVPAFEVDTHGWTDEELVELTGIRWFGPLERRTSPERLVPVNLADVIDELLAHGVPDEPWQLAI
jgi:8-oxo-dGTP pyrophosphatase MutT (NUDIX family)